MKSIITRALANVTSIVAFATPLVVATATEVLGELTIMAQGAVTAVATWVTVRIARSRPAA